jgi:CelD/BcsL family acetyltransferase involved in cellulose biosynthesis
MNNSSLIIEKINNINTLETIKDVWNSLLENNETKTVELTYEWQMAYWQQFHQEADLFVLIIHEAGSIIAISPLKLTIKHVIGIKVRCLEIIAGRTSNYQDLIIGNNSEDVLVCILDYLLKIRGSWDQLSLLNIPETSKTARFFVEKLGNYPLLRITEMEKCIYLAFDKSWEEYNKSRDKGRKSKRAYKIRKIERDMGKIHLKTSATEEEFQADLQQFFQLHRKRWNPTSTPSIFNDSRYCKFYSEAGRQLYPKGQLGLSTLQVGGTTLAQSLFFVLGKNYLGQLLTYNTDYSRYSPSVIAEELFVEDILSKGAEIYDFGSYYPWKEIWANQLKNKLYLLVFPKRFIPYSIYDITKLYLALRSRIRQHPRILKMIKVIPIRTRILKYLVPQGPE